MGPPIYIGGNIGAVLPELPRSSVASMGPPIYIGGNRPGLRLRPRSPPLQWGHRFTSVETPTAPSCFPSSQKLQWGHRFTSVETCSWKPTSRSLVTLQWGHRFTSVETSSTFYVTVENWTASMGPPIYIGGNEGRIRRLDPADRASMGPPIYIGGNKAPGDDVEKELNASMGPPIYIGGNDLHDDDYPRDHGSFNGATDLHRWKRGCVDLGLHGAGNASMGPPIYIGGNAATRLRWRSGAWLQWGHRFTSVETLM